MNYDQIMKAVAAATPYGQAFSDVDGHPALVVQHVPSGGTGATAATADCATATDLTFQVDGTDPAGLDAIGDSSGVVAFATYTTMGALKDYIDGLSAYRAYLVGGLRADASASKLLTAGAASCFGDTGLTFYHDASSTDFGSFAISGERFVNNGPNGHITDAVGKNGGYLNSLMVANINVGITGATPLLNIYAEKQAGTTVQTLDTRVMVDDTLEAVGTESPDVPYIQAPIGYRLVGRVSVATTYDDIATFTVLGKCADLYGNGMVVKQNW